MKLIIRIALLTALCAPSAPAQGLLYTFPDLEDRVAPAGDVDLDGHPDALFSRVGVNGTIGTVSIRSGASGNLLAVQNGVAPDDGFGFALAGASDVHQDGAPDFVVGAPFHAGSGRANVFSGATGLQIWAHSGPAGSELGSALDASGDVDGDGVADVLVGAPAGGAIGAGMVRLLSGATGGLVRQHDAPAAGPNRFGEAVVIVGDVDGDGRSDYAVGAPAVSLTAPGTVTLFSGANGSVLRMLAGAGGNDAFGSALASIGDVDGDARPDLLVGAPGEFVANLTTGAAWLFSGASGALIHHVPAVAGTVQFASSVAGMEDYDGDGVRDFAAHHRFGWIGGVLKNVGRARILSGTSGAEIGSISSGYLGPIARAGDVNLDQVQDLLVAGGVGTPQYSGWFLGQCAPPVLYCTAKTSSLGCIPQSAWTGAASASIGPDLTLNATELQGNKNGLLFWSSAQASIPFAGGWLCVAPPFERTALGNSGGSSQDCSGALAYTFTKSYLTSQGLTPGSQVYAQFWMRDGGFTPPDNVGLTRGTQFTLWP